MMSPLFLVAMAVAAEPSGALQGDLQGVAVDLPLLKTDMEAWIDGDLATVHLVQTFTNPSDAPMNARYTFPLPENAAVHAMKLTTADQVIEAKIDRRAAAEASYETAKREGQQAALLTEDRENVFVQQVANVPAGEPVTVEIEYAQTVVRRDGAYDFVFPMVVGPRYTPKAAMNEAPSEPPAAIPSLVDPDRVAITVHLDAGMPITRVVSPSHAIAVDGDDRSGRTVSFARGTELDNRDFVLDYTLASDDLAVGASTYAVDGHGVVSLLVEPPVTIAEDDVTARELVFVVDTSCSMDGAPLDTARAFMHASLGTLRPNDTFRIVRFSDDATEFDAAALPPTAANLARANTYVDGLVGGGGTELEAGLRAAFAPATAPDTLRLVVFLTDGYIGNDDAVLGLLGDLRGDARLFSLGIGTAVNRWLVEEMARVGRGSARVVLDPADGAHEAEALAARMATPVLTDVTIDWGGAPVRDVSPAELPDLFDGDSLRVLARFDQAGEWPIVVRGKQAGRDVSFPYALELPASAPDAEALPIVWARGQIADRMGLWLAATRPSARGVVAPAAPVALELQEEITTLGLEYRVATRWTAFVAIGRAVGERADPDKVADVAVPQVQGVSAKAYDGFVGNSAPEPAGVVAGALLALMSGLAFRGTARRNALAEPTQTPRRPRSSRTTAPSSREG